MNPTDNHNLNQIHPIPEQLCPVGVEALPAGGAVGAAEAGAGVGVAGVDGAEVAEEEGAVGEGRGGALGAAEHPHAGVPGSQGRI